MGRVDPAGDEYEYQAMGARMSCCWNEIMRQSAAANSTAFDIDTLLLARAVLHWAGGSGPRDSEWEGVRHAEFVDVARPSRFVSFENQ